MSEPRDPRMGKTMQFRLEQYRDRWTSFGEQTGLEDLSDKLTPEELKRIELFGDFDDKLLEKISPDVSVASWRAGSTRS